MNFLDNLLRYPRFFISSVVGLILVLISPFVSLFKEVKNKNIILFILLVILISLGYTLNLMINSD